LVSQSPQIVYGDTWTWNGIDWTEEHPAHSPPARYSAAAATVNGVVVLFGGRTKLGGPLLDDTWTWDGSDWTEQHPTDAPPARADAMASAYHGSMVLFGGCANHTDGTCDELGDTWMWEDSTWKAVGILHAPSPRALGVLAYDGHDLWLYGGQSPEPEYLFDTWKFEGSTWTEVDTAASPGDGRDTSFQCK
jgi:hypothetical protein